ncbi:pilus assembly protein [Serratia marcescens]|uniref:fimbrial protein n=1 Tax=Serratia marcescens TaxID=615 RepID=UPI000CDE22EF|nr:fimbrial protein [Serratia marcescens]POW88416.1 pilus assembly protein [Serratia marcescens]POW93113.1 pilus assembly protein [Serratia marcescens]POX07263.1 pilus assembly protein [Serratia marcescens]POX12865.1 pilus assembly protein [Serratia marcescens]POX29630.1 pilus assembly protein [Serratia marcescens]
MKNVMRGLLLVGSLAAGYSTALAAGDMAFKGTLIEPPPCTINDGNLVDVDFGDRVGINKVDGVSYRQPMNYQIKCGGGGSGSWALTLSLIGTAASFDNNALKTNKDDLGIRIYQNDKPFTPGSTLSVTLGSEPHLEAVPVKNSGATLTEGAFEALATLRADYQ